MSSSIPSTASLASTSEAGAFDYVLVGGGLASALLALAIFDASETATVAMVEAGSKLGGNHTWAFHAGDVPEAARRFVEPLVVRRWDGYDVSFPDLERHLDHPYAATTSERVHDVVSARFAARKGSSIRLSTRSSRIESHSVTLDDGTRITGSLVVDARGPEALPREEPVVYQKFLGLEVELRGPGLRPYPLLMDARVPQEDGFRFFYTLPLDEHRALIEDTYYSDTPELDEDRLFQGVLRYAAQAGFDVARVVRVERGALPLVLHPPRRPPASSPLLAGYRGGFFHPTTGYSFPVAVRLAMHVAATTVDAVFEGGFRALVTEHQRQSRYAAMLNRLLFTAIAPAERFRVMERFYGLSPETIRRFYALQTTAGDRARILCGRPPRGMSIASALSAVAS